MKNFVEKFISNGSPINNWIPDKKTRGLGDDTAFLAGFSKKGSAAVELVAVMPLITIFVIVIVQFSALFTDAVHNVAVAYANASSTINRWNELHATTGFTRPCMGPDELAALGLPNTIHAEGNNIGIGVGDFKKDFLIPQEVKIGTQKICNPW